MPTTENPTAPATRTAREQNRKALEYLASRFCDLAHPHDIGALLGISTHDACQVIQRLVARGQAAWFGPYVRLVRSRA